MNMVSGFGQFHTNEADPNKPGKKLTPYLAIGWSDIFSMVDQPQSVDKAQAQWLMPSTLPRRNSKDQEDNGQFLCIWGDLDDKPPTMPDLAATMEKMTGGSDYEIYNTRSATPENQKARILIPLKTPLSGSDFILVQQVLNDQLEALDIKPDRAAERPAQLCYLPNKGSFYGSRSRRDGTLFDPLQTWAGMITGKRDKLEADHLAIEAAKIAATERRAAMKLSDAPDLISAFNQAYTPHEWMTTASYDQRGDSFRHPNSETGNYSASVRPDANGVLRVNTLSSADPLYTAGHGGHDAFGVFTILMHGGDRDSALIDAGDNLLAIGLMSYNKAVQIDWAKSNKTAKSKQQIEPYQDLEPPYFPPHPDQTEQPTALPENTDAWEQQLIQHVSAFNKIYASVMIGGKHRVMRLEHSGEAHNKHSFYAFYSRNELSLVYENTLIKTAEKKVRGETVNVYANLLMAWQKHPKSKAYTGGVVFLPGKKAAPNYFNTWRGFSVEPKQNDSLLGNIYGHMEKVVCGGYQDLYQYLLKWIAYTIQNPDKPAESAIVLRGEKGSGKGIIGRLLCWLWGNHGLHIANAKHLVGNFNGHFADRCFIFADEAFFSGDKQHEGVLKALVTEPTVIIERKGIDAVAQPNYIKIFMATNSDFAVPASRDERRYCVLDVSSSHIGDRDYFTALHHDCVSKDAQAAFLYAMQHTDLTGWHPGDIPDSTGLRAQRFHSMDSVQKWVLDALLNDSFGIPAHGDYWQTELNSNELFTQYVAWCDITKAGEYRRLQQCQMAKYLGLVFSKKMHVGGRNKRGYYFGTIEEATIAFETYEKINLLELASDD